MNPDVARQSWRTLEPVHAMVYFAPEPQEEYAALGLDVAGNRAVGYFPPRAAAMGAVTWQTVQATFFNFSPLAVQFGMAGAWDVATPEQVGAARLRGADRALRRLCGELLDDLDEAVGLARTAAEACTPYGRPLYAAHAGLAWPDEPHLQLW
ncbi:MAG: SCO6745 family protein, partial [Mycobacteriales bacterium]